ncbi:beta-fructofuranosidase [Pseudobutyrivibrio sp. 49]|uniref:glycoside hydrolase family 32 protein n=1 Tax=Pseudobutyrivibrio sp. 49 TaxID=1855344 RepID=UPI000885CA4D|nr:glycoside hydrolase family 32 protein [Pseudobutyrivibrio sp. 49]SDH41037.1 beta-fructofuranosidase [Pseudobutyrivibrio sp. 49]
MSIKDKKYLTPRFHLFPISGWLNDPNGLCQLDGVHHIFFQYSPDEPKGGEKDWGHFSTKDFINYEFSGVFMKPDMPEDASGVYSGCAYVEDNKMYIYYTGNVKHPGDYDYILEGRESNTILVTSEDGIDASEKRVLLRSEDYPDNLTLHVRDPKVWYQDDYYYMTLGARKKSDEGCVILFKSKDKINWKFSHFIEFEKFGYMWECPDLFYVDGKQFLSVSPQGLEAKEYSFQNIYQAGYFNAKKDLLADGKGLGEFTEWDYGFDFYAPQTYVDEKKRTILIAWMGMPDAEYGHDISIKDGWQHMLSLPRELVYDSNSGKLLQQPIAEIMDLREEKIDIKNIADIDSYELNLSEFGLDDFSIQFNKGFDVQYNKLTNDLVFSFSDEMLGSNRTSRKLKLADGEKIENMKIYVDTCSIEIFINDGLYTFTTKCFKPKDAKNSITIDGSIDNIEAYSLNSFNVVQR